MNSEKVKEIKKALGTCMHTRVSSCRECPYNYTNTKTKHSECFRMAEHALTLINELENENEILKINMHETENLSFQINQMNGNLVLENQRLHTELKKYKKALELLGKQYMSDMGMGKSIEDDTEYYEINLRNIIQTAIKQAGQEEQE